MKTTVLLILGVLLTPPVQAASRISTHYNLASDTVDAGGLKAASAVYSADGSIGGIAGYSTVAAPAQTARHGYVGQLYEVTNLAIAPLPVFVNEGTNRIVRATALCDDGTRSTLSGAEVRWSLVENLPFTIDTNGTFHAGIVCRNLAGFAQAAYLDVSKRFLVGISNVNHDDCGVYARDGLDDEWQVTYFGEDNPNAAPGLDPDGDGQTNGYEYVVGTVPTDADSRFRFRIGRTSADPAERLLYFSPDTPGRVYEVEFKTNVNPQTLWAPLPLSGRTNDGPEGVIFDSDATQPVKFYRMKVRFPPTNP